ncbi:hypothetical protein A2861_03510 [Candidatus Roizmanbacteria bacterium RIFCSPHIGHO2_01_FULL_38_15]|nr:MAG: hypothetical protein A2861_03510 [Candidatus Roizmanbacteria bacterium RIFCSPHIGHO2_01_FULL_38_15]
MSADNRDNFSFAKGLRTIATIFLVLFFVSLIVSLGVIYGFSFFFQKDTSATNYYKDSQNSEKDSGNTIDKNQLVYILENLGTVINNLQEIVAGYDQIQPKTANEITALALTAKNIIRNSSFESASGVTPRQWRYILDSTSANTKQTDEAIRSGNYGLKFFPSNGESGYDLGISQDVTIAVPGRTYVLSAYVKNTNVNSDTKVRIGFWNNYKNEYGPMEEIALSGTKDWYRVSTTVTTDGLITDWSNWYPVIELRNLKNGYVYLDDIQLEEGAIETTYASAQAGKGGVVMSSYGDGSILSNVNGTFFPAENGVGSLGTTSNRWRDLYLLKATINENGDLSLQGDASVGGDLTVNDTATFNGDITFGDSSSDTLTFNGTSSFPNGINVGQNDEFTINSSGNITKINNVSYSFPSSQGNVDEILINDGSGTLSWGTFGAASVTADSLDFAQFVDAMTIDSTTTVNLYSGTSDVDYRFYNSDSGDELLFMDGSTGRIGIGTTAPGASLVVAGNISSSNSSQSEKFGLSASTGSYIESTALGYGANTTSHRALAIGSNASASHRGVALGTDATATDQAIAIGKAANASGTTSVAIGYAAVADQNNIIVIGRADNSDYINQMYIGSGRVHTSPVSATINASGGSGTNIAGANISVAGGRGTGSAVGGDIFFKTASAGASGATLNSLTDRMIITDGGLVGIGTTAPVSMLSVGASSQFQVDSLGNIVKLNNVTTSFPSSQGGAGSLLTNDGAGILTWGSPSGTGTLGYWQRNGTDLAPSNIGDFVGIGTTAPISIFHVEQTTAGLGAALFVVSSTDVAVPRGNNFWNKDQSANSVHGLRLDFSDNAGTNSRGAGIFAGKEQLYTSTIGTKDGYLAFQTSLNNILTEYMRITSAGNVGIGTTDPSYKLDINLGNIGIGNTDPSIIFNTLTATDTDFWMGIVEDAGGDDDDIFGIGDGTTPGTNLFLGLDTSGNLGIGTTALNNKLEVAGGTIISGTWVNISGLTAPSNGLLVQGRVGIGTTAPAANLSVVSSGNSNDFISGLNSSLTQIFRARQDSSGDGLISLYDSSGNEDIKLFTDSGNPSWINAGNFGIGITDPGVYKLYVSGAEAFCDQTTCWNDASDIAFKSDVRDIDYGLDEILALQPRRYTFDKTGESSFGLIAQEVEQIIPEVVSGTDGNKGIAYGSLTPLLIKAIQQQNIQITDRTNRLTDLETNIALNVESKIDYLSNSVHDLPLEISDLTAEVDLVKNYKTPLESSISELADKLIALEEKVDSLKDEQQQEIKEASESASFEDLAQWKKDADNRLETVESIIASLQGVVLGESSDTDIAMSDEKLTLTDLTVTGKTNLYDVGVIGQINAGLLVIDGIEGKIDSLGTALKIQSAATAPIEFMAGKVKIDKKGNLMVQEEITAKKYNVDTTDSEVLSIGQGTIPKGKKEVLIKTKSVTDKSKIFLTPKTELGVPISVVDQKDQEYFKISIIEEVDSDVVFNWWVVN